MDIYDIYKYVTLLRILTNVNSFDYLSIPREVLSIVIPLAPMWKLRHREAQ